MKKVGQLLTHLLTLQRVNWRKVQTLYCTSFPIHNLVPGQSTSGPTRIMTNSQQRAPPLAFTNSSATLSRNVQHRFQPSCESLENRLLRTERAKFDLRSIALAIIAKGSRVHAVAKVDTNRIVGSSTRQRYNVYMHACMRACVRMRRYRSAAEHGKRDSCPNESLYLMAFG